ncbi:TPA: replication protein [Listeria monocytogenes]|nr:replication protein [Listeria monocytogenes]HDU7715924.1 replication protein [Listeria monocytogenes]
MTEDKKKKNTSAKRTTMWAFLLFLDSAPKNYKKILDSLNVPYMLSPVHNKDIKADGKQAKKHIHGVLHFETLKSQKQVVELLKKLETPKHIEPVLSTKGMYHYFTHANNNEKFQYSEKDIVVGCGLNLEQFLSSINTDSSYNDMIDIIEEQNILEFSHLVAYARENNYVLLATIIRNTPFFSKYIDSRRYSSSSKSKTDRESETEIEQKEKPSSATLAGTDDSPFN